MSQPKQQTKPTDFVQDTVVLQGHRGCRGLMPENTIPGFEKAIELGVSTLELDVILSGDGDVIVSHEPWMNEDICQYPKGRNITELKPGEAKSLNIYKMTTEEVQSFLLGTKPHPKFPEQLQVESYKPTLQEVEDCVIKKCRELDRDVPQLNIEIKSRPSWDNQFHPEPREYARIFLENFVAKTSITDYTIQSFDPRILNALNKAQSGLKLVYLVDSPSASIEGHLDDLNFKPSGISPYHRLVSRDLVMQCTERGLMLSTWTVNKEKQVKKLLEKGVRNIITDYPDRMRKIIEDGGYIIAN